MLYMVVSKTEDIRSGKPVIKETRVTLEDISETFYKLGRKVSEVSEDFGITEEEVEKALRYSQSKQSESIEA